MTNDNAYIDQIISEHIAENSVEKEIINKPLPNSDSQVANENSDAVDNTPNDTKEGQDEASEETSGEHTEDYVEFPKKAKNAIDRQRKLVTKERARNAELAQEVQVLKSKLEQILAPSQEGQSNNFDPHAPHPSQYPSYEKYLIEQAKYELKAEMDGAYQKNEQQQKAAAEMQVLQSISQAANEFTKNTPEAKEIFEEYANVLDSLPIETQNILAGLGNQMPMAVYNLAKMGELDEMAYMTPAQVAVKLGRALAYKPKVQSIPKVSNAPIPPATSAKGKGVAVERELTNMSTNDLMKWIHS